MSKPWPITQCLPRRPPSRPNRHLLKLLLLFQWHNKASNRGNRGSRGSRGSNPVNNLGSRRVNNPDSNPVRVSPVNRVMAKLVTGRDLEVRMVNWGLQTVWEVV